MKKGEKENRKKAVQCSANTEIPWGIIPDRVNYIYDFTGAFHCWAIAFVDDKLALHSFTFALGLRQFVLIASLFVIPAIRDRGWDRNDGGITVLYMQKVFGLYCHARTAWRTPKKAEKYFYFLKILSSSVFFS